MLCENAICHVNFTGSSIIENMDPSGGPSCETFADLNALQTSNAIFNLATEALNKLCLTDNDCNPELKELFVFN